MVRHIIRGVYWVKFRSHVTRRERCCVYRLCRWNHHNKCDSIDHSGKVFVRVDIQRPTRLGNKRTLCLSIPRVVPMYSYVCISCVCPSGLACLCTGVWAPLRGPRGGSPPGALWLQRGATLGSQLIAGEFHLLTCPCEWLRVSCPHHRCIFACICTHL